ncbi:probable protein phosphatase 2C 64 isoform X1 [Musa acuminata AAA Group]|uniref:probable protein phosphatase 2C 64 isoform X1 n=1 Tax=Musa acuminata AAA Group TaxID=214697 RepID=UPI0031DEF95C
MGNCLTAIAAAAAATPARTLPRTRSSRRESSQARRIDDGGAGRRRDAVMREDALHVLPGRIFSNEGRSSVASIYTQQGCKGINQDAMILWEDFGGQGVVLCGVFDGHGPHGHLVARKVRDALPLKLLSLLPFPGGGRSLMDRSCFCFGRRDGVPVLDPASSVEEPSLSVWREAFVRSSKAMDKELRSHPSLDCFCSGSTAVILLKLGFNLFIANIGDSRAVLGCTDDNNTSMLPVQLTVDLKPDLPKEAERIKRCRGRVFALQDEPEVSRVWLPYDDAPGLAMARAFGDFCLKDYGVISVPEFFHWNLTEKDQFVVLASDGVWDVLTNKDVVDIISSSPTRSLAAKVLVETAAREWKLKYPTSRMDDCAVVCLYLDGQTNTVSESLVNCSSSFVYSYEDSKIESDEAQNHEPTLDRNFTVRPTGNTRISVALEEHGTDCATEDGSWSGLEGVTRVNSIVQLPRFSDEKMHGDACL